MKVKKSVFYFVLAIVVIGLFGILSSAMSANAKQSITGNVVGSNNDQKAVSGEYQNVKLSYENYVYVLDPPELKMGVPVRMEVDMNSVVGCMQAVRIPGFGVSSYVREGDNIIEFTPDKSGTFNIACSMGMGATTFDVVDNSGEKTAYVESAPVAGSCGASEGGCGCGG
ncbi:hypothetical protein K9L67_00050 [Candidatus Woesearchaeota archaeon]|nr:hypothetical protein [Candidatus Woesearchaeota archaeon]MCF7900598.1 hypothetical protein [Candidatus Woesearchaeota archaeon]MCF8013414.1 hypothetical protein [Candidatus Woesearchaeota archaeon]